MSDSRRIVREDEAPAAEEREKRYRVLLPLSRGRYQPALLHLAVALARFHSGELLLLHVVTPQHDEDSAAPTVSSEDQSRLDDIEHRIITLEAETVPDGILQAVREFRCSLVLLAWRGRRGGLRNKLGRILDPVIQDAPCDVVVYKSRPSVDPELEAPRMLLLSGDQHHTKSAVRFSAALAAATGGRVTLLAILRQDTSDAAEKEAAEELDELIRDALEEAGAPQVAIERMVLREKNTVQTVKDMAEDYDLAVLTASGDTILNQLFVGSLAERLARDLTLPTLIIRRYHGLPQLWMRRMWRRVDALLPTLPDDEQIDVYKRLRRGARGTTDFYTLLLLSAIIATMGLLLNSGAVVIGAMLVAPLMTPILAVGLGVVMGDLRLLQVAAGSALRGILLGVGVSALLAWLAPFALFTSEIESRTHPNLFDLTVALAAGAAGAFGISRQNVAAALSGVAVAAALVPPLSVIGICLATGRWEAAGGATLLFVTNLIAISLAAAVIYLLLGFFPQAEEQHRHVVLRYGFLASLLLLFVVSVPLARSLEREASTANMNETLRTALQRAIDAETDVSLFNFTWDDPPRQPVFLKVTVYARDEVTTATLDSIRQEVHEATGREVNLQLVVIPSAAIEER